MRRFQLLFVCAVGILLDAFFLAGAAAAAAPRAATVTRADGTTISGTLRWASNGLVVNRPDSAKPVNVLYDGLRCASFATPTPPVGGLLGEYFADSSFTSRVAVRLDPRIDFQVDRSEQLLQNLQEKFGVRWTGQIVPPYTESYTIGTASDDGMRVWLDGKLIIDQWSLGYKEATASVPLVAGKAATLRVEYMNDGGALAKAQLWWSSPRLPHEIISEANLPLPADAAQRLAEALSPPTIDSRRAAQSNRGLQGDYFSESDLKTDPVFSRRDANIDFNWGEGSPGPGVPANHFGARWRGRLTAPADGEYRFIVMRDNGVRLWIDGKQMINAWDNNWTGNNNLPPEISAPIRLSAGHSSEFKLEYFEDVYAAVVRVEWEEPKLARQVIPPTAFSPPAGSAATPPAVEIEPRSTVDFLRPRGVTFAARCLAEPSHPPRSVEYLVDDQVVASSAKAPFSASWASPQVGVHRLSARLIDADSFRVLSDAVFVTVGDGGSGDALPADVCSMRIGQLPHGGAGDTVSFTPAAATATATATATGTLAVTTGTGSIWQTGDGFSFVYAPAHDASITAQACDFSGGNANSNSAAGLMVRASLAADAPYAALVANRDGSASLLVRNHPGEIAAEQHFSSVTRWSRLTRRGANVTASVSDDGVHWTYLPPIPFLGPSAKVYVGVAVVSTADEPVTVHLPLFSIDHLGDDNTPRGTGIELTNGTFLAGQVRAADAARGVRLFHNGYDLIIPLDAVANVIFAPSTEDLNQHRPLGKTGLLLTSGDFAEGDFQSLQDGAVAIMSSLFGLQTFSASDAMTLDLRAAHPEQTDEFEVETIDGSRYRTSVPTLSAAASSTSLHIPSRPMKGEIVIDLDTIKAVRRIDRSSASGAGEK